ncbi:MAG: hypothetical protein N3C60_08690, partial [Calditerrivibrio sp.]|nr:hypothetical protein [Calditerrivibrio sp.]
SSYEPFRLGIKVDDPDNIFIINPDMTLTQPNCSSSCDYATITNNLRALYGILNIKNAYGPVNYDLDMPAYIVYFDPISNQWKINNNDSCTDLTNNLFTLSNYSGNLNTGETQILSIQKKGNATYEIKLKAPGNNNDGSVKLRLTGLSFLQNADIKYPLSEGVATFGIYGNHNKRLYWKEVPAR